MESWTDIRSMNMEDLTAAVEAAGEKKFRAKQIYGWLHQKLIRSGDEMKNVPAACREKILREHPLYGVRDVYNSILVKGNISGPMMFYGCGAGKLPTAGAVIADVIAAARNKGHGVMSIWDSQKLPIEPKDEMKIKFFLRLQGRLEDRADQVKAALPAEELVSLDGLDEFGVLTGPMTEAAFEKAASGLEGRISMIRVKETGVN